MASSNRIFDRMLGIFITLGAGLALMTARQVFRRLLEDTKREEKKKKGKGRHEKAGESTGDEYFNSRNTAPPNFIHNGSCHCQRIRFRLKAPQEVFAVDVPSKIRYPRLSLSVENFEPLSDEHIMSMYAVKSVDSGLGIHTFCSYCGMHVLFAPSTNPHEVQVNVDCLDRANISKVFVTYMAAQDSAPVPSDYSHAQPYNRRGSGAMYNKVSGSGAHGGGKESGREREKDRREKDSYGTYGGLVALQDATRYSSPDSKGGKGGSNGGRGDMYQNYPFSTPPTASSSGSNGSNLSKKDSNAMSGLFSEMTKWLSPFSKLKHAAIKQREAHEACESYFETYYGAAGANSEDYAVDAYVMEEVQEPQQQGDGYGGDFFQQAQAQPQSLQASPGDSRYRSASTNRFNMSDGIGGYTHSHTPGVGLQKQLSQMKHNLGHHLQEDEENGPGYNYVGMPASTAHINGVEELSSM